MSAARMCKDCRYYDNARMQATCRYNPPTATAVPQQTVGGVQLAIMSIWPPVKFDDWCRNFNFRLSDVSGSLKDDTPII